MRKPALPQLCGQPAGLDGRHKPQLTLQPLPETVVRRQRGGPVARGGQPCHEPPHRLLGERVERHLTPGPRDRGTGVAAVLSCHREPLQHLAELRLVLLACLEYPVVVESGQQLSGRTQGDSVLQSSRAQELVELRHVHPNVGDGV
jgi:hypothetical protein